MMGPATVPAEMTAPPPPSSRQGPARLAWLAIATLLLVAVPVAPGPLWRGALLVLALLALSRCWQVHFRQWQRRHRDVLALFEQHVAPTLLCEPGNGTIVRANPAAGLCLGQPPAILEGQPLAALCLPPVPACVATLLQPAQPPAVQRVLLRHSDGTTLHVDMLADDLLLEGRRLRLVSLNNRTAEATAAATRDLALQQLRQTQDSARIDHWRFDPASGRLQLGLSAIDWLQLPASAHRDGLPLATALPAGDEALAALALALAQPQPLKLELDVPLAAGSTLSLQLCSPAVEDVGSPRLGTLQDISEQVRTRRTLDSHQHHLAELVRGLPHPLLIARQYDVVYCNPAAAALYGVHPCLAHPLPLQRFFPAPLPPLPSTAQSRQMRLFNADGQPLEALVTCAPMIHRGEPAHLLVIQDISEAEAARRQLQASNGELQAMAQRLFSVQEDERRAISRDLHDDIGQAITAMKLAAHSALGEPDAAVRDEDLRLLLQMADQTVGRLRDLSTLLRPPQLDALGLEAALSWQARTLVGNRGLQLDIDVPALSSRPDPACEQACFRIAQESLTNIVRHAHAGSIQVTLHELPGAWMELQVHDDGDGFDPDGPRGLGLVVMRERAQGVGGTLHIDTAPGAGTRLHCRLPFQPVPTTRPSATA